MKTNSIPFLGGPFHGHTFEYKHPIEVKPIIVLQKPRNPFVSYEQLDDLPEIIEIVKCEYKLRYMVDADSNRLSVYVYKEVPSNSDDLMEIDRLRKIIAAFRNNLGGRK